ncbi:MAG: helix-turn-helix transcriptional regulator [Oscillospiraceae bacterium]|nr:helix-turn-helix transcriptional regulator [Oscillospiraceae bacterium]
MDVNHNTALENIEFNRTPCFWIYDSPEYKEYPMHWHNAVEILMPTENVFPVICGDKEYILNENDILIIPPGELHNLKAQHGRRIIMLCDNAMFKDNPALAEVCRIFSQPVWINENYSRGFVSELNKSVMEMVRIFDSSPSFCEIQLYGKLIEILLKIAKYNKSMDNKSDEKKELIKRYIDTFYMSAITLDSLSEAIGYSKFHLSRFFTKNNTSFSDMLNARRIKEAEIMLRNENTPITQVAMNVGFSSITTFNRAFRKFKDCTPTQFRKMYREGNE